MKTADLLATLLAASGPDADRALRHFVMHEVAPQIINAPSEAAVLLQRILQSRDSDPLTHALYGDCLRQLQRYGEAEGHLERALHELPHLAPARLALAEVYLSRDAVVEARAVLSHPTAYPESLRARWIDAAAAADTSANWHERIDPGAAMAVQADQAISGILAARCGTRGATVAAIAEPIAARSRGFRQAPALRVDIAQRLALPFVYSSSADLDDARNAFDAGMTALEQNWPQSRLRDIEPALEHLSWSNFLLAYQGRDDLALQRRYGDWLSSAATCLRPDLGARAQRVPGRKPRVGIVSGHWYSCTAGWYFERWVDALAALPIDLEVIAVGAVDDAFTDALRSRVDRFLRMRGDADAIASAIHARDFDLLIYPEIGMKSDLLPIAALRLAPMQWVGWGHPVTTGLPTIDRFITCGAMEPPGADAHYRESLLRLPGIGTRYFAPAAPAATNKADLGLPNVPIVVVPQSTFKVHPDNDLIYRELLDAHRDVQILFVVTGRSWDATRLRNRIRAGLDDAQAKRVRFLPFLARSNLLRVLNACDLMLDTLHWSGGNTSLDALRASLPVLTAPGSFMRGRQSAAMLRELEVDHTLVTEPSRLARQAAELLRSDALPMLRSRIGDRYAALTAGDTALATLADAVMEAVSTEPKVLS